MHSTFEVELDLGLFGERLVELEVNRGTFAVTCWLRTPDERLFDCSEFLSDKVIDAVITAAKKVSAVEQELANEIGGKQ